MMRVRRAVATVALTLFAAGFLGTSTNSAVAVPAAGTAAVLADGPDEMGYNGVSPDEMGYN
jgi:Mn2+/Fe2+ NRAMP family transporter